MPKLKLGIQCQEKDGEVYRYNRVLRPVVVKSINILDPAHYARLAAENPGVELVYRQVPNGPWDGEGAGRRWAEHLYRLVGHIPQITLIEGHNEYIHAPPHNTPEDYDKADRFMSAFIDWVHELWQGRVHAVVLNASCGHFNEDIVGFFPRTLGQLQLCGKCLLALHEYDHPDSDMLGDGEHDLCGKFLRNLAGLRAAAYDKVRIAITECGVDSGVGAPVSSGHVGFKHWGEDAATRYLNERNLGWYLPLAQETDGVAWATIFGCGMHGDWSTFDIKNTEVIDGIGRIFSGWSPPEPPKEVPMRVFDKFGDELLGEAAEEMVALHGLSFEMPPALSVGDRYFKLIELREKPSNALVTKVLDLYGDPIINPDEWMDRSLAHRAFWWSSIDSEADDIEVPFSTDHHMAADLGGLNANGEGASGMGRGAYHDPYTPGPHECWVRHPTVWSMLVLGQGMLGATDHLHLDMLFQEWVYTGNGEEPPGNGTLDAILAVVKATKVNTEEILRILKPDDEPPPPPPPPPPPEIFTVRLYNSIDLSGPVIYEMTQTQPFWNNWEAEGPGHGVTPDYFSGSWTGIFSFEARVYTFNVRVDDGARLYVDDVLVLDVWKDQSARTYSVQVPMKAGPHKIVVKYYEKAGHAILHVNWL